MRTVIPAIAIVVLLCLCAQWQIDQWRYFRDAEERLHQLRAAQDARSKLPTSQPSTQPAPSSAVAVEPGMNALRRYFRDVHHLRRELGDALGVDLLGTLDERAQDAVARPTRRIVRRLPLPERRWS